VIARKTLHELAPMVLIYLVIMQVILIPAIVLWPDIHVIGQKIKPFLGLTKLLKQGFFTEIIQSTAHYSDYYALQAFFKGANVCGAAAAAWACIRNTTEHSVVSARMHSTKIEQCTLATVIASNDSGSSSSQALSGMPLQPTRKIGAVTPSAATANFSNRTRDDDTGRLSINSSQADKEIAQYQPRI
jgi:hypothetical protein